MSDVTRLLQQIEAGNSDAAQELLPLIYDQLRTLAHQKLRHEPAGQTLQGTALVHEAYLRLMAGPQPDWQGRRHFFAAAAEAMRRILVDNARKKRSLKHGGDRQRLPLEDVEGPTASSQDEILDVHAALAKLAMVDPQKAELVKLRYFAGLPLTEVAELLGISRATAVRHWTYAKAWLFDEIHGELPQMNS